MNPDFLDLIAALNAASARFLVVGGYAVAAHGHVRATKDLDVWVEPSERDLASPHYGFMMGAPPRRIDILTTISGVAFEDAWQGRLVRAVADGVEAPFIGIDDLLANNAASARPQDLADIEALRQLSTRE